MSRSLAGAGLACAGLALGLAGCDQDTTTRDALHSASVTLATLTPDTVDPTLTAQERITAFESVVGTVQPALGKGTAGEKSQANVLVAQARLGAASPRAELAAQADSRMLSQLSEARSWLGQWIQQGARAEALAAYDPGPETRRIDEELVKSAADQAQVSDALAQVQAKLLSLRQRSAASLQSAQAERVAEASLIDESQRQTGESALATFQRAIERRRAADRLEQEAQLITTQADALEPQVRQLQATIEALTNRQDRLKKDRQDVADRHAATKAQLAEARELAQNAASKIDELLASAERTRIDEVETLTAEAVEALGAASNAAGAAGTLSHAKAESAMIRGQAEQALGTLHASRAVALDPAIGVLEDLHSAVPPLPRTSDYSRQAEILKQARDQHREAAIEAITAAFESFGNTGSVGQDAQEQIDAARRALSDVAKSLSGGAVDLASQLQEAPTEAVAVAGESQTAVAGADRSTPQGTFDLMMQTVRDQRIGELAQFFSTTDPTMQGVIDSALPAVDNVLKLNRSMRAKFGSDLLASVKATAESPRAQEDPMFAQLAPMLAEQDLSIDGLSAMMAQAGGESPQMSFAEALAMRSSDMTFEVNGDRATVRASTGSDSPMSMVQRDGQWFIDLSMPAEGMDEAAQAAVAQQMAMLPMIMPFVQQIGDAAGTIASSVDSGRIASKEDAVLAIFRELAPIMQMLQGMGQGMGGLGGMGGG